MLPKPEKNNKILNSEQLDLVNSISSEEKIIKKRRFILLFLGFTVGLSFVFWSYRSIKLMINNKSYPKVNLSFSLPSKLQKLPVNSSLDSVVNTLVGDNNQNWLVYASFISSPETKSWQLDPGHVLTTLDTSSILDTLVDAPQSTKGPIASVLPAGARVQETLQSDDNYIFSQSLITVPQKQIFLLIRTSDTANKSQTENTIKLIAEKIYWHFVNLSTN